MSPVENKNCSTNALEWFAFISALVFLLVPWWLTEMPDIFLGSKPTQHGEHVALQSLQVFEPVEEEEPLRAAPPPPPPYSLESGPSLPGPGRGKRFLHAVQWNCLRCIQPGYLAIFAMIRSSDHRSWPALYYFGHDQQDHTKLGIWYWAKIISVDVLPLGLQALLIYMGTTDFDKEGKLLPGWWVMGLMPPTMTGLYVIGLSFLPYVPSLKAIVFGGVVFHAVAATALIVPVAHTPKALGTYQTPATFGSIIAFQWFLMVSPMAMYRCPGPAVHLVFVILATVLRGAPLATALGVSPKDFPFCIDNLVALPILFGLVQCGGVFMLACFSSLRCERERALIRGRRRFHSSAQSPVSRGQGPPET
jgi:hypothetical protein